MQVDGPLRDVLRAGTDEVATHRRLEVAPAADLAQKAHFEARGIRVVIIVGVWRRRDDERGEAVRYALAVARVRLEQGCGRRIVAGRNCHVRQHQADLLLYRGQRVRGRLLRLLGQDVLPRGGAGVRAAPQDGDERQPEQSGGVGAVVGVLDGAPQTVELG